MELKLGDNGSAVLEDGKPVYVDETGREIAVDVPSLWQKVHDVGKENAKFRLAAKEANEKLVAFGEMDPQEAAKAIETVRNLSDKKLLDAGEVEKIKAQLAEVYEKKLGEAQAALSAKDNEVRSLIVGKAFRDSAFINDKMTQLPEFVEAYFGQNFAIEDGAVVAKGKDGNPLMSPNRPGEMASFEEAIEMLVSSHPNRDHLLKGAKPGSGSTTPRTGGMTATKSLKQMSSAEKASLIGEIGLDAYRKMVYAQAGQQQKE